MNVSFSNYIKVEDIIKILNKLHSNDNSNIIVKNNFNNYDYENSEFLKLIGNNMDKFSTNPKEIIYKYFKE